jgi:hypothetical protein
MAIENLQIKLHSINFYFLILFSLKLMKPNISIGFISLS